MKKTYDINDLVAQDLENGKGGANFAEPIEKGGIGSGQKGHKTAVSGAAMSREAVEKMHGHRDHAGLESAVQAAAERIHDSKNKDARDYHTSEWNHLSQMISERREKKDIKKSDTNKMVAELLRKGGPGSGKRGHRTAKVAPPPKPAAQAPAEAKPNSHSPEDVATKDKILDTHLQDIKDAWYSAIEDFPDYNSDNDHAHEVLHQVTAQLMDVAESEGTISGHSDGVYDALAEHLHLSLPFS